MSDHSPDRGLGFALATWSVSDPSLNHATDAPVHNALAPKRRHRRRSRHAADRRQFDRPAGAFGASRLAHPHAPSNLGRNPPVRLLVLGRIASAAVRFPVADDRSMAAADRTRRRHRRRHLVAAQTLFFVVWRRPVRLYCGGRVFSLLCPLLARFGVSARHSTKKQTISWTHSGACSRKEPGMRTLSVRRRFWLFCGGARLHVERIFAGSGCKSQPPIEVWSLAPRDRIRSPACPAQTVSRLLDGARPGEHGARIAALAFRRVDLKLAGALDMPR